MAKRLPAPRRVTSIQLAKKLMAGGVHVVHVISMDREPMNRTLREHFCPPSGVRYHQILGTNIDYTNPWIQLLLGSGFDRLGWARDQQVPAGYYLFYGVTVLAYDPGIPDADDWKVAVGGGVVAGAAGVVADWFSGGSNTGARAGSAAFKAALDIGPGSRMATFFADQLGSYLRQQAAAHANENARRRAEAERSARQRRARRRETDAIDGAYTLLGIDKAATDDELRAAHRARLKEWHPDLAGPDASADEVQRRTRLTGDLNNAWSLLKKARRLR